MSVDAGGAAGTEAEAAWAPSLTGTRRGIIGRATRRRLATGQITEVRGPAACMRRDAAFRRALLVADVVAIVGAFVLTVALSRRVPLQLTWVSIVGVPMLLVGAKLSRPV